MRDEFFKCVKENPKNMGFDNSHLTWCVYIKKKILYRNVIGKRCKS